MDPCKNESAIVELFQHASAEGRGSLHEQETYELLRLAGLPGAPETRFLRVGQPTPQQVAGLPGAQVVLKVVSPTIAHKTEAGGVRFVDNQPEVILKSYHSMMAEVPRRYSRWIESSPEASPYPSLKGAALEKAVERDIQGVLLCPFVGGTGSSLGDELFVGLRRTREFGTIISAGLGGLDTELLAASLDKGLAVATTSVHLATAQSLLDLFRRTLAYRKLAGLTRDGRRRTDDDTLLAGLEAFLALGRRFSPQNPDAPFILDELEVNPFVFSDGKMIPLDGLCRFSLPQATEVPRPLAKIRNLLHPASIAIIGVSSKGLNMGRIILRNILGCGFDAQRLHVIRPDQDEIDGVRCYPSVAGLPERVDLLVLAVGANQVPALIDEVVEHDKANGVILIPGGLGEKEGSKELEARAKSRIQQAHSQGKGPVFIGGNSLGILSRPGRYDTLFIPKAKLPHTQDRKGGNVAFISQSGAFMITRMSNQGFYDPAFGISLGNQIDLTVSDLLRHLKDEPDVDVLAVYVEGFRDQDGLAFARAVREARSQGKDVIFYKAGRTPEGRSATSGHTASIAGDYSVCEALVQQSGACIAQTFTSFQQLTLLASLLHHKEFNGPRVACLSNAGYEAVGMADSLSGGKGEKELIMATLSPPTIERLQAILKSTGLYTLVDVKNPMDITPMASDAAYGDIVQALMEDPQIDALLIGMVPLTPAMQSLPAGQGHKEDVSSPESSPSRLKALLPSSNKPLITVVDSGPLFDPMAKALQDAGIPTFRSADQAMRMLATFIAYRS